VAPKTALKVFAAAPPIRPPTTPPRPKSTFGAKLGLKLKSFVRILLTLMKGVIKVPVLIVPELIVEEFMVEAFRETGIKISLVDEMLIATGPKELTFSDPTTISRPPSGGAETMVAPLPGTPLNCGNIPKDAFDPGVPVFASKAPAVTILDTLAVKALTVEKLAS
jgi:hypothetical protein